MAVVLRSSSDLVYLPDHGFVGIEGGELARAACDLDPRHINKRTRLSARSY